MIETETINPSTLKDALVSIAGRNVMAIAGGTDLLVRWHDVHDRPVPRLLVLDRIKPLHKINIGKTHITLGPLVTFSEIIRSAQLRKLAPQLAEAASIAGSVQIRNRATIGGNIANGSPAGDLIPPLYVLVANLELSSQKGKRTVSIEEFFKGPGETILKQNELIIAIKFEKTYKHGFFLRLATRKALAISKVSVAVNLSIKKNIIDDIKIALGAVAPTVIRAYHTEKYLLGNILNQDSIAEAAKILISEARPIDDIRSLADYRKQMVGVLLERGLREIIKSH
ncbi:MAG: xanthine dehydrogenase family protein subunit M [candidate division Zixibacteria bacterium]|nr:xanthine dehydrogenase family protein subunit M [candidate division Zixibacteria bacterium]